MSRLQTLNNKIEFFAEQENEDSFLVYANQKLLLTRKLDRLSDWLETYVDLQDFYRHNHSKALQYLDEALGKKWREPKNPDEWEQLLYVYTFQGYHLSQLSRIWPAVQAYESARTLYEKHRFADYEAVQWLYKPLGNHYTRLGDKEKALVVFQMALLQQNKPDELAGLYVNMALAYWNSGNIQQAQTHCEKGLVLQGVSPAKRALLLGTLALVKLETGLPKEAADLSEQALRLLGTPAAEDIRRIEDRARIRRTAALAYMRTGQFTAAKRMLDGALADQHLAAKSHLGRDAGKIELAFSEYFLLLGQPTKALEASNRALSCVLPAFKPNKVEDNPDPLSFYEENTIFEALVCKAEASAALAEKTGRHQWLQLALDCHDLAYLAETRLRGVFQYESSKLELQSDARNREEAAMQVARMLFEKTGSTEYLEKGFEIAERSKATLLLEAMAENLVRQQNENSANLKTLSSLRYTASWYNKQLILDPNNSQASEWRSELDVLNKKINDLKKSIPGISTFETAANGLNDVHFTSAGTDALVVEYFVGKNFTEVFVCENRNIVGWNSLVNDANFYELVHRFQAYFADGNAILNDPDGYLETAFWLWGFLVPTASRGSKNIVIIPDGFINFIPFEALIVEKPDESTSLQTAAYLVRNQTVRYAWSLQTLQHQDALTHRASELFFGLAPIFTGKERGLAPLQASRKEWEAFGFGTAYELTGKDATTERFLAEAGNYQIVHLSTHAHAGTSADQPPGIEFMDETMLLSDVYALPLQADLVVLSACETGMGENVKGEGVMSLARAFAHAGAACVVSSLWPVNDQTTASLMGGFYRHLKSGQTIGTALRQAKLDYLNDPDVPAVRQSPYFWAGMVEVGSDRTIDVPNYLFVSILAGVFLLGFLLMVFLFKNKKTTQS